MSKAMNRRMALAGAAIGAVFAASEAAAQTWWPWGRRRQDPETTPVQHQGHGEHGGHGEPSDAANLSVVEAEALHALMHCDAAGETCLTHCLALMAQGDGSMAACARGVREMLAVCGSTRTLLQSRSALVAAQLAVCRDACSACRAACLPHTSHHAECAACAEACTHAIAAIDALMA